MPQGVSHDLIWNIVIHHGTGQRCPECVGATFASARYDTGRTDGGRCQFPQKMHRDMGERGLQAEKNVCTVTGGPFMLKIIQKRRLDFRQHGQRQWSSGFLLCQADRVSFEIQFLKRQGGNVTAPNPQTGRQQQCGIIPLSVWPLPVHCRLNPPDLCFRIYRGHGLGPFEKRHNAGIVALGISFLRKKPQKCMDSGQIVVAFQSEASTGNLMRPNIRSSCYPCIL